MKNKWLSAFLLSAAVLVSSHAVEAKYADEDPNLIWKDTHSRVYMPGDVLLTERNSIIITRHEMQDWESQYGADNPTDIIEIDLQTGEVLRELSFDEIVSVETFNWDGKSYVAVLTYEGPVRIYDENFKMIHQILDRTVWGADLTYENGRLHVAEYREYSLYERTFEMNTFDWTGPWQKNQQASSSYVDARTEGQLLELGSYDDQYEWQPDVQVNLSQLGPYEYWQNVQFNKVENGYVVMMAGYSAERGYKHFVLLIDGTGQIVESIETEFSRSGYFIFNGTIVTADLTGQYHYYSDATFKKIKSVQLEAGQSTYNIGYPIDRNHYIKTLENGFKLYNQNYEEQFTYNNPFFESDSVNFTDRYFYDIYTDSQIVVDRNLLKPVFYSTPYFADGHVHGDYFYSTELIISSSGNKGAARIYKLPENPEDGAERVDRHKVWTVQFTKDLAYTYGFAPEFFVKIYRAESGEQITSVKAKTVGNKVIVEPPTEGYTPGLYYLHVNRDINSTLDKQLGEDVFKPFFVE